MKPVVLDTSIWVNWLRGKDSDLRTRYNDRVIYIPTPVVLELFSGAHDIRTHKLIHSLVDSFNRHHRILLPSVSDLQKAGETIAHLKWSATRQQGDALIAVLARKIGAELVTLNLKDFAPLARYLKLDLYSKS